MKTKTRKLLQSESFKAEENSDYSKQFNEHLNKLRLEYLYKNNHLLIIDEEDEIKTLITAYKKDNDENLLKNELDPIRDKSEVNFIFIYSL